MKEKRPTKKAIQKFVDFLDSIGCEVCGPYRDFDKLEEYPGCMDYTVDDIVRAWTLRKKLKEVNL